jgi:hypothetical protein
MQLNDITFFFKGLEQSIGLPLWAILIISIVCFIYVYLYGILIPIKVIRTRKELLNLRQVLGIFEEKTNGNYQKQGHRYKWRT